MSCGAPWGISYLGQYLDGEGAVVCVTWPEGRLSFLLRGHVLCMLRRSCGGCARRREGRTACVVWVARRGAPHPRMAAALGASMDTDAGCTEYKAINWVLFEPRSSMERERKRGRQKWSVIRLPYPHYAILELWRIRQLFLVRTSAHRRLMD